MSAVQSAAPRVGQLDVLRGVAVLMVLFRHNPVPQVRAPWDWVPTFLNAVGWAGVDLFFVLSGYLVGGLLLRELAGTGRLRVKRFLARRAIKVWPSYYALLAAYGAARVLMGPPGGMAARAEALLQAQWPNLIHLQNYLGGGSLGWLWSLGVEEHFYLVLPLVLPVVMPRLRTRGPLGTAVLLAAVLTAGLVLRGASEAMGMSTLVLTSASHLRFDALFAGVLLAHASMAFPDLLRRLTPFRHLLLLVPAAALVPAFTERASELFLYPWGYTLLTLGAMAALLHAQLSAWRDGTLVGMSARALSWVGVRSYSIYVWHGYFANPLANRVCRALSVDGATTGVPAYVLTVVYVLVPVVLGALMFVMVEEPGMRLRRLLDRDASQGASS